MTSQAVATLFARDPTSDESSEVVTWVRGTYITEYCFLALAMLVLYDNVCTMDKEVRSPTR